MAYVVKQVVLLFITGLQLAMLGRAICSWLPLDEENPLETFFIGVTEPVIYPIRVFFHRMNWFVGFPLDMAFMVTILLLGLLGLLLR